jgi:hypothetical protein
MYIALVHYKYVMTMCTSTNAIPKTSRPWKALLVALELYPQSPSSSSCSSCSHLLTIFSNLPLLTYLKFRDYMMPQSISSSHSSNSAFLHHLFTSLNTIWLWGVSPNDKGLHLSLKNSLETIDNLNISNKDGKRLIDIHP